MDNSIHVRAYGGTLHGQFVNLTADQPYLRAVRPQRLNPADIWRAPPPDPRDIEMEMHQIDTYKLNRYHKRSGNGYKTMQIALLEGRPLFREEEWQMERDMDANMWAPYREPNFLTQFDEWIAWCTYKHTKNFNYVRSYVYGPVPVGGGFSREYVPGSPSV